MPRYYVYELAYPDGTPFYCGKGTGDRIEIHERETRANIICNPRKMDTIRDIWVSGQQVQKRKLAFFDDEQEAYMYEWAMTYLTYHGPSLTNFVQLTHSLFEHPKDLLLGDDDDAAIAEIKQKYGLSSDSDAIRLALRVVASGEKKEVTFNLRRQRKEQSQK